MKFFNPKVSDFLKSKPDLTMIGMWWALYWRGAVVLLAIALLIVLLILSVTGISFLFK